MTSRSDWLKQRMAETAQAGTVYKVIGALLFLIAIAAIFAVIAPAIAALFGQTAASASDYYLISSANQLILQGSLIFLSGVGLVAFAVLAFQPTHLLLSDRGIRFAAKRLLSVQGKLIPWNDISEFDVVQGVAGAGSDFLIVKAPNMKMRLTLSALSQEDRLQLLDSIKRWAPLAVHEPAVVRALTTSRDQTYTEVWLQAFTAAPKRDSMMPLQKGAVLNEKYTTLDYLGMGGQGTAYLAKDSTGTQVVLKEFILPIFVDASIRRQALKSFENESRILKSLHHPNVVKLLDFFVADQRGYIVLEYVDGPSLKKLVEQKGALSESEAVGFAIQVCEALEHLHNQSPPVVHRDVTPDNLIVSSRGTIKLVDFNVAHQSANPAATSVVGKQAYIPPEQFRGTPTIQSDIYAAGGTLFFLLTGQEPDAITVSHPRHLVPSLSERIDEIVAKATALETKRRYTSAALLKQDLAQL